MKKSNLLRILRTFSPGEIKEFSDYLNSPFFNKNKGIVKLYGYLKRLFPAFDEELTAKKNVWSVVFPDAEYNDGLLRIQMFNLANLALDYIQNKEASKDKLGSMNFLLRGLNTRGLYRQFEKSSKQIQKSFSGQQKHSEHYHYNRYLFELEKMSHLNKIFFDKHEKFLDGTGVNNIINNAEYFYIIVLLKSYLFLLYTKQLYETTIDTNELDETINKLDIEKYNGSIVIMFLFHTIKLQTDPENRQNFHFLKEKLRANIDKLRIDEAIEVLINMENYCKKQIRKGNGDFHRHLFDLYRFELEKKTYKAEHNLSNRMYLGICKTGLFLGNFDWVKNFIEDYKDELDPDTREDTCSFARAIYEFSAGNFNGSVELLLNTGYKDVYNKFEVKSALIKCYYELKMFDKMEAVMDSYRHLLTNDRFISADRKAYYVNFIRASKGLIRLSTKFDQYIADKLREKVTQPDYVLEPSWFLKKIDELEKRPG